MKNKILTIIFLMALTLAACSTTSTVNQSATTSKTKSFSSQAELIVGILKLEGTNQAVTAKQASELLPLWEVTKVLASSGTAAQVEIDAAARQIKETLTPSQLQAINAMKLTQQDVSAFEQSLNTGITIQSSSQSTTSSKSSGDSGGPPDGGGPGGDSLGGVLTGMSQLGSSTTSTSAQVSGGVSNQIPSALLDAIIKLMKNRANA
jgi:hypothetical protein